MRRVSRVLDLYVTGPSSRIFTAMKRSSFVRALLALPFAAKAIEKIKPEPSVLTEPLADVSVPQGSLLRVRTEVPRMLVRGDLVKADGDGFVVSVLDDPFSNTPALGHVMDVSRDGREVLVWAS